jgi:hypothetical protein
MTASRRLIVYAKRPLPGHAKTRLGRALGDEQAAGVYARLLYTYLAGLPALERIGVQVQLDVAAPADVPFFTAAFPEFLVRPQVEGNLGRRMAASFDQAFQENTSAVVLTGSDVPNLDAELVAEAFELLQSAPVVIGPAADGGYYLLGFQSPGMDLFDGIAWSTDQVLAQTLAQLQAAGLPPVLLPELLDVDTVTAYTEWLKQDSGVDEHR